MAVQRAVAEQWKKATGVHLLALWLNWGASVTGNPYDLKDYTAIGLPVPSTEVRIVDDEGKVAGNDQVGELQVRGPQVMRQGYWQRPGKRPKKWSTKMVGYRLVISLSLMTKACCTSDRKKDMILVSGFNVYPNEIEDVVALHGKVLGCGYRSTLWRSVWWVG